MRDPKSVKSAMARAFALAALILAATGCGGQDAQAMLVETAGAVTVNGKAVKALPSAPVSLATGDALEVGPKGMARLVYPDGSRFMLLPHDGAPASLAVTPRASSTGQVVVKLLRGALAFLVPPKRPVKDRYELRALNTVTTIEGTAGRVITGEKQDSVALEHGAVTVAAGAATTKLTALQQAVFDVPTAQFKVGSYDPTATVERDFYDEGLSKKLQTF